MAPNPYLAVRKIFHPLEWLNKLCPFKEPRRKYLYCSSPVPGIYGVDEKNQRFLIAIKPIPGQEDLEHIFAQRSDASETPSSTYSSDIDLSTAPPAGQLVNATTKFPENEGLSQNEFHRYRYLRYAHPVEYNTILTRWMFTDEMKHRIFDVDCIHGDKLKTREFLALDIPNAYVLIGYVKKGKLKIEKNHRGMNEGWWEYYDEDYVVSENGEYTFDDDDEEDPDMIRAGMYRMDYVENGEARERLARRKYTEFYSEDGGEEFMKVVRYVRKVASPEL